MHFCVNGFAIFRHRFPQGIFIIIVYWISISKPHATVYGTIERSILSSSPSPQQYQNTILPRLHTRPIEMHLVLMRHKLHAHSFVQMSTSCIHNASHTVVHPPNRYIRMNQVEDNSIALLIYMPIK